MVWFNTFAYDHNLPQDKIGGKVFQGIMPLFNYTSTIQFRNTCFNGNFKVPTSHLIINCNINNSCKLLALNAITVTQSFINLFPTFSNTNLPGKFDTRYKYMSAILDIFRKVLRNTYDVTYHVQSNLCFIKHPIFDFKTKSY